MAKIAVVGSINLDYVVETDILPNAGETVLGRNYFFSHGGKGANQAVAAARLGANVSMFGSLGQDETGYSYKKHLESQQVCVSHIQDVENVPSGVAFIEVCDSENRIIVVAGANDYTDVSYIKKVKDELLEYDVIVFQLETPLEMLEYIVPILHEQGKTVILDPAPAQRLSQELIDQVTYLTPNEHEYRIVFGKTDSKTDVASQSDEGHRTEKKTTDEDESEIEKWLKKYPNKLIITCGSDGVRYFDGENIITIPSLEVTSVDSTGAGDTFSGAFAVGIAEGKSLYDSVQFATVAAGISVLKKGAQSGMPTRAEVELCLQVKEEVKNHESKGHLNKN